MKRITSACFAIESNDVPSNIDEGCEYILSAIPPPPTPNPSPQGGGEHSEYVARPKTQRSDLSGQRRPRLCVGAWPTLARLGLRQRKHQLGRRQRRLVEFDAKSTQGVVHRIEDGGRRRDGAAFVDALDAVVGVRRRGLGGNAASAPTRPWTRAKRIADAAI